MYKSFDVGTKVKFGMYSRRPGYEVIARNGRFNSVTILQNLQEIAYQEKVNRDFMNFCALVRQEFDAYWEWVTVCYPKRTIGIWFEFERVGNCIKIKTYTRFTQATSVIDLGHYSEAMEWRTALRNVDVEVNDDERVAEAVRMTQAATVMIEDMKEAIGFTEDVAKLEWAEMQNEIATEQMLGNRGLGL